MLGLDPEPPVAVEGRDLVAVVGLDRLAVDGRDLDAVVGRDHAADDGREEDGRAFRTAFIPLPPVDDLPKVPPPCLFLLLSGDRN